MRSVPLVLFLVALAAPLAAAQIPGVPPGCGPLEATVTVPAALAPGERGDVTISVENAGNFVATVTVAANVADAGWSLVDSADQTGDVPAGGSASFTYSVTPAEGAAETATVNFSVSGTCNPPVGACPQGACDAAPVNQSGTVTLRPAEGLRFPGLENVDFPVEYLIAGIVLVGIAAAIPFLLRKKKGDVAADCPEPLKMVRPGRGTSFPIELRNPGAEPATARFEVGPLPEGWSAFMPLPEVQLAARETRNLWLMVRAPAEAATGAMADIELRLRSGADAKAPARLVRVRAEVNPSAAESAPR